MTTFESSHHALLRFGHRYSGTPGACHIYAQWEGPYLEIAPTLGGGKAHCGRESCVPDGAASGREMTPEGKEKLEQSREGGVLVGVSIILASKR
jgi:hypothetical protein